MFRRALLFIATNALVIATVSIITSMLGIHPYLSNYGLNYTHLAVFCALWGTTGSFISLLFSKTIAKMAMGAVIINPRNATREEQFLLEMIAQLAQKAKLEKIPEVGIYHSQEMNAFATGPSQNDALIAVSSGLLANMNKSEIEGVLAHEIAHVANGDMVTMTLVQGIVNSFALFLSRVIAYTLSHTVLRSDENDGAAVMTYGVLTIVFDILFTLLGSILVAAYSRWREYRADYAGAELVGRTKMIAALEHLQHTMLPEDERAPSLAAFKIAHHSSWLEIFSTHPPLEKRIARLIAQ